MSKLENTLTALGSVEQASASASPMSRIDPRAKLLVTLLYLVAVLSFSLHAPAAIILFALYPVVGASMSAVSYGSIFLKSLVALPFIAGIGIFNPILHTETAFSVGSVAVSYGWVEFASICLRGLLSVQAVLLLIYSTGFYGVCRAMSRLGVPRMFAAQLMFLYRYIFVLVQEAMSMDRARRARSYGRRHYSLSLYGTFVGQLLLRTVDRARRIYSAMEARGYTGSLPPLLSQTSRWHLRDTLFLAVWTALFAVGRFTDIAALFG